MRSSRQIGHVTLKWTECDSRKSPAKLTTIIGGIWGLLSHVIVPHLVNVALSVWIDSIFKWSGNAPVHFTQIEMLNMEAALYTYVLCQSREMMSKYKVNSNSSHTGGQCLAVLGICSQGYLFSFMVILRFKLPSWNVTAERTIMNGSFASGTDRSQKCFHITDHLGCVCLCIPECSEAPSHDWGVKSCRDILRRFLNLRSPVRKVCYPLSVRHVAFSQKPNKCEPSSKKKHGFF